MSIPSPVKFLTQSLFALTLVLSASNAIAAEPLPKVSTTARLSDTVLDRPTTPSKDSLAQSRFRNRDNDSKRNDVGIGFRFGNSTSIGIDAKVGISDNFSLRPSLYFSNKPGVENKAAPGAPAGTLTNQNSGIAYGLAATYDIKLDENGRTTAYIGPKIEFSSASGALTAAGISFPGTNINVNQTKIGLMAGGDFAVSDDFTIGANTTLNISNSISGNASVPGGSGSLNDFQTTGSSLEFGIRAAYRF
jgi:hypothetical protein